MIVRQVLIDITETIPAWASVRRTSEPQPLRPSGPVVDDSEPARAASETKPAKRTRRPKANGSADSPVTKTTRGRTGKKASERTSDG
jgi:hypothetical protein